VRIFYVRTVCSVFVVCMLGKFVYILFVIHTVKGFGIVNKAEIDVFLELSCFFDDPADVGNLISGSSAFSKTSLNIRKFTVHILLKPGLKNFNSQQKEDCELTGAQIMNSFLPNSDLN